MLDVPRMMDHKAGQFTRPVNLQSIIFVSNQNYVSMNTTNQESIEIEN